MKKNYKQWLEEQKYALSTVQMQLTRVKKVEDAYGSLDEHFDNDTISEVIESLTYTAENERRNDPNPSKIAINGAPRKSLQSYKNAANWYKRFRAGWERKSPGQFNESQFSKSSEEVAVSKERFSLEQDMQMALRNNINQLGEALTIDDEGVKRSVRSGFIDITCKDEQGNLVVIELKAGNADGKAIGQILGYMGDLAEEEECKVSGILVAQSFDKRVRAAAKMVPSLKLISYAFAFEFAEQGYEF